MKGSDASAAYDRELPAELWELSDDEHEFQANRVAKSGQKRKTLNTSAERHRKYEKTMNQCNTFNTKVCNLVDARKKSVRPRRYATVQGFFPIMVAALTVNIISNCQVICFSLFSVKIVFVHPFHLTFVF